MDVTGENSTSGAQSSTDLYREILDAFNGKIRRVSAPVSYRLGILLVAMLMVILPLIYIGIIILVGYAVYYHAANHTELLQMGRGRGRLFMLLLYVAPMVIGGILVMFMFKPLLSRPAKRTVREPLSSDEEPLLFAFVERICEAVRAPKPRRIELDEEVNASAGFHRGFLSMLGNDLVLTIGLPLVAGLNLRQFAGVLAHEFGHFAQGAGMRLTYIIRSISHWFTRVVYERDQWDEQLVEWSEASDLRFGWILYLARMFVWITRGILWVLMITGHTVSGFMLRQMEFDADRHEARLAGSDAFESTSRRIVSLSVASRAARSDLGDFYREGRLCDDFPKLIFYNYNQFTPELLQKIDQMSNESKTGWMDTHPCDAERIASAKRENTPGIFQLELPASVLFADFEAKCEQVTWEFYREMFGDQLTPEDIHPVDDLLKRQEQAQQAFRGLHRFLQGTFRGNRPLRLPSWQVEAPGDAKAVIEQVKVARQQMVQAVPKYEQDYSQVTEAMGTDCGEPEMELISFETLVGRRLGGDLQLLLSPDTAGQIEGAARVAARGLQAAAGAAHAQRTGRRDYRCEAWKYTACRALRATV